MLAWLLWTICSAFGRDERCDRGVDAYVEDDWKAAVAHFEGCLDVSEDAQDRAWAITQLGRIALEEGRVLEARDLLERAYALRQAGTPAPRYLAETAYQLGWTYGELGAHDDAVRLLQVALASEEERLGTRHPDVADTLNAIAVVEKRRGGFAAAEKHYLRSLDIRVEHFGAQSVDAAVVLSNLGALKKAEEALVESREYYERGLAALDGLDGDRANRIRSFLYNNLSVLLQALGDEVHAEHYLREALALRERVGASKDEIAQSKQNLARFLAYNDGEEEALDLYRESMELFADALGTDHRLVGVVHHNLGVLLQRMGRHREAGESWEAASSIFVQTGGFTSLANVEAFRGSAALERGDAGAAIAHHERSLELRTVHLGGRHVETGESHHSLAVALMEAGKDERAREHAARAEQLVYAHVAAVAGSASARELGDLVASRRHVLDTSLELEADPSTAWALAMRWKGLARRIAAERHLAGLASEEAGRLRNDLTEVRAALAAALVDGQADEADLRALMDDKEGLERDLVAVLPEADQLALSVSPDAICAALAPDEVLVDFIRHFTDEDVYTAFVVDRTCSVHRLALGDAAALDEAVVDYVTWLQQGSGAARGLVDVEESPVEDASREQLVAGLWRPLSSHLHGAEQVVFVPDGALARLPLPALPTGERVLLERTAVAVLDDANDLLRGSGAEASGSGAVVVGDVDFGQTLDAAPGELRSAGCLPESFAPLPGTVAEARDVSRRLARSGERVSLLTGRDASPAAIEQAIAGRRYVHLATHGFYAPPSCGEASTAASRFAPLALSGVALAGGDGSSGLWTAEQMATLDLRGVELVVLSACETGLGQVQDGNAVLGLRRALALAGVESMVISLWSVPDEQTGALMQRFYRHKPWKRGAAEALRRAQRDMIRTGEADSRAWAAFVVLGAP